MCYFFISIDSSLGKIDKSTLSQQTLMELLVENLNKSTNVFLDPNGSYMEVSTWHGVTFRDDSVKVIDWHFEFSDRGGSCVHPGGSIDLQWIPGTVISFHIGYLKLEGSVDTVVLPRGLERLRLDANKFCGTFLTEHLPRGLTHVGISRNNLSGSLDMTCLPAALREFIALGNSFSGTVDLTKLPGTLEQLSLSKNALEGSVNLENLPRPMKHIELHLNRFQQDVIRLPSSPNGQSHLTVKKG
mmetsp:Transcript_33682/g.52658  ORF Transcript_33682/g.52658 Transcript_33682/m.52658 type:complete len:243 (-) Transcript_33682:113-841(-)